jgi:hypothetical protein
VIGLEVPQTPVQGLRPVRGRRPALLTRQLVTGSDLEPDQALGDEEDAVAVLLRETREVLLGVPVRKMLSRFCFAKPARFSSAFR